MELGEAGIANASCSCPYAYGGYCKHIIVLLLTYTHHPKQFTLRKEPAETYWHVGGLANELREV